ncbi:hypothetical protein [uncultured Paludibaculum sp.]|uniref:hypothetical protein n=1 Tax=uncultured Paludibaculum sp. TaxID=1765020 RepID=UPI002AABC53F|nr:hypothetical protein [uncultured Paludibaculum sp.]
MKSVLALLLLPASVFATELSSKTLQEFQAYMEVADRAVQNRPHNRNSYLPATAESGPQIMPYNGHGPRGLTSGLVHDWVGAIFVPKAKASDAIAVLQDVNRYKDIYAPDVIDSKVLKRDGDHIVASMRVVKKKVITVVLDTDYDVEYRPKGDGRYEVWSRSRRIVEVEHAGGASEHVKPPDTGYGFLWRLNSYWYIEERDGGVYMECRAISLTRDIPLGVAWAVKPMVTSLPRESLLATLEDTREAVQARLR